jgi:hypothetical protein
MHTSPERVKRGFGDERSGKPGAVEPRRDHSDDCDDCDDECDDECDARGPASR